MSGPWCKLDVLIIQESGKGVILQIGHQGGKRVADYSPLSPPLKRLRCHWYKTGCNSPPPSMRWGTCLDGKVQGVIIISQPRYYNTCGKKLVQYTVDMSTRQNITCLLLSKWVTKQWFSWTISLINSHRPGNQANQGPTQNYPLECKTGRWKTSSQITAQHGKKQQWGEQIVRRSLHECLEEEQREQE